MWKIEYTKEALKKLEKVPKNISQKIISKISSLENLDNPLTHPNIKPLVGKLKGLLRLRVGNFRVIFEIQEICITIITILPRGDAYK